MIYPVVVHHEDGSAYGVTVPDFIRDDIGGCFSAGDTFAEALDNTKEAIQSILEILVEDNKEIPKGSNVEDYLNHEEYQDGVWALVDIDLTPYLGHSKKINVTLPDGLIAKIDKEVSENKYFSNRSKFLAIAAQKLLKLA